MPSPKVQSLLHTIRKTGLTRNELRELEEAVYLLQQEAVRPGQASVPQLPPKVPTGFDALSRAVCLLGNRLASDLKDRPREELIQLIGTYPSLEQAGMWKQALNRKLREAKNAGEVLQANKTATKPEKSEETPPAERPLSIAERLQQYRAGAQVKRGISFR